MKSLPQKTLLPLGFEDLVAPRSSLKHGVLVKILEMFSRYDYSLVEPPLVEYEESLLTGADAPKSQDIFRFIDPISRRTLGVRGDITLQVIRLAKDHLSAQPRPLRLAYCGHVLRIANTPLRPQRQFMQIGLEQIGGGNHAETEVLQITLEALNAIQMNGLCVNFSLPTLLRPYKDALGSAGLKMLEARSISGIKNLINKGLLDTKLGDLLAFLFQLPPDPQLAIQALFQHQDLVHHHDLLTQLSTMISQISQSHPDVKISLDIVEQQGFGYKTGIAYRLFADGQNTILGRGGRYQADKEHACGVSLNLNNLLGKTNLTLSNKRLFIPYKTDFSTVRSLYDQGWNLVFWDENSDIKEKISKQNDFVYKNDTIIKLDS